MTVVRKRHVLTGMKYDRVDLVGEGANGHADILIAKNRQQSRSRVAKKAMGRYECGDCGASQNSIAKSRLCISCESDNLNYVEVLVSKKVTPVGAKQTNPQQAKTKKVPKNDDATNAGQYTFEDEQYDQDNGENGQALGDAVERSVLNKNANNWVEVDVNKMDYNPERDEDGSEVGDVDNTGMEEQKEGADSDKPQEAMAEKVATGLKPDREVGYQNTATNSSASVMATHKSKNFSLGKKKSLKKEKPGLNSWDYGDQGSQEVAESAEQMYRSNSQPTRAAQTRQDSTKSKVVIKARRKKSNHEGLDIMDHGASGIYEHPGQKRYTTGKSGSAQRKISNKGRTQVAPPGNPMDRGGVNKSANPSLATMEALNLGVQFAENMGKILKSNKPELYEELMTDFVGTVNAAASEWFVGSSITKSRYADKQANDIAERALKIISKASPASEMSDEAAEGEDPDKMDSVATNSVGKLKTSYPGNNKNEKEQTVVGKKKISKSLRNDPYAGLNEEVMKKLQKLDELEEERAQNTFLAKARELKGLPGYNEEKVAKQLRDAYEADQEGGEYLEQTLRAAANATHDSTIFKQFGMPGQGTDNGDPMAKAVAYADSHISKSGDGPSRDQLMADYMKDHGAEFYMEAKVGR